MLKEKITHPEFYDIILQKRRRNRDSLSQTKIEEIHCQITCTVSNVKMSLEKRKPTVRNLDLSNERKNIREGINEGEIAWFLFILN